MEKYIEDKINNIYNERLELIENNNIKTEILLFIKNSILLNKKKNQYKKTNKLLNEEFSGKHNILKIYLEKYTYDNSGDLLLTIIKGSNYGTSPKIRINTEDNNWTKEYIEELLSNINTNLKKHNKQELKKEIKTMISKIEEVNTLVEDINTSIGGVDFKYENQINFYLCKDWRFK